MNIEDVKQIPIADYLHSLGYSPVKQQGNGLWYKSPFREEHEPSFKVNTDRNLWYDFGAGKGGNIIALAKELYCSDSLPYLLNRIAEQTPHVRPVSFSFPQRRTEPSFQHLEVRDLTHPALLRYLQGRGINIELAKRECKELHFTNNGRPFFASKYSINSLVYWVTYVHNVVYSFYRSMIYCYINSTQRCAGSIVIDIIPTNGADKRKFFPFAPYFPVTNVIKRYFYPYFPAIIGIKGYSFPYFPYLSGIMKIKTALYSLFSRLDWHKTVVFPCLGEIYEGIRSLSWEIPVT